MSISSCCKHNNKSKKCRRKSDGKIFDLPRRFTRKKCKRGIKGFTARSSCAPYKDCMKGATKKKYSAVAVIDMNNIKGTVRFTSINDRTTIRYNIVGLSSGYHGMHIHKCGDLTKGCDSGCEHFNPTNSQHGGPHSKIRHAGDLEAFILLKIAKSGVTVKHLFATKRFSIIGRMIILHEGKDDLGKETQKV